jgi:hypothetical protein
VLSRVCAEAVRTAGAAPDRLRMTHPAQWGTVRKQVLLDAAAKGGLPAPELIAEPVAAAVYYTQVLQSPVRPGGHVVVFDFGGGTLDVAIVARSDNGFEVVAVDGRDDLGGLDIDAMVIDCIADGLPADALGAWQQLMAPSTPQQRRAARVLWEDARTAKEMLSRQTTAPVQVPLLDRDVHVTRGELETKARPRLTEAATLTAELMRRAGIGPYGTGLFLVGGASRIPLVATTLLRATHVNPTALDRPELVVAIGALTPTTPAPTQGIVDFRGAPSPSARPHFGVMPQAPSLGVPPAALHVPASAPPSPIPSPHITPTTPAQRSGPTPPARAKAAAWPAALFADDSPQQHEPADRSPSTEPRALRRRSPQLTPWWVLDVRRADRLREARNIGIAVLMLAAVVGGFALLDYLTSSGS